MTTLLFDFVGAVALKGVLLLALSFLAMQLIRRGKAAQRHRVLSLAMVGLLALPLASFLVPAYAPDILPAATQEQDPQLQIQIMDAARLTQVPAALSAHGAKAERGSAALLQQHRPGPGWLLGLMLLGAGVFLLRLLPGWLATRRLLRGATPLAEHEWQQLVADGCQQLGVARRVQLYQGEASLVPLTFGVLRPVILLPVECRSWPAARRRLVLLHELAHVKRQDCLQQLVAQLACAMHWFNPLAWRAERILRDERELAADALVLGAGVRPSAYASELLAVARSLRAGSGRGPAMAVAMAGASQLETRLVRILDPRLEVRPPGRRFKLLTAALAIGLLLPLGALHGWAGVPGDEQAAERTMEALRAQVGSGFAGAHGERPARVELTLDPVAQALIEQELSGIAQKFRPTGASIVALDPRSGAILGLGSRGGSGRNLAVEQAYEPASTLKVFSIAAALDAGAITPEQSFSTDSGSVTSGGTAIHDVTPAATLSVADILARSSNIGSIRIYRTLGKQGLVRALGRFHFGERPELRIPAGAGTAAQSDWSDEQVESLSFGHGLFATPLQIAAAFAAVANQGMYHRPTLVRRVVGADSAILLQPDAPPEQVLKPATAQAVLHMLEGVVHRSDGTGTAARIPGYRVAGKTGTGKHTGWFVGTVPAADPRLVLLVVVDGPEGAGQSYYGNSVAAPSFRRIAEKLLPHLLAAPPTR